MQRKGMERATRLLLDIAGGEAGPIVEAVSPAHLPERASIRLRASRVERLLGVEISAADIEEILGRLGMTPTGGPAEWTVSPPSFRFDLAIESDLVEEIGRVYGYDKLPSAKPLARLIMSEHPEDRLPVDRMRDLLVDRGFQEAVTYSFVDPELQAALDPEHRPIPLANPMSSELSVMRTSMMPGLVGALRHNLARQQSRVHLFETGLVFLRDEAGTTAQVPRLGGVLCGDTLPEQWGAPARGVDFFDTKGNLEAVLSLSGRAPDFRFEAARHPALHPGRSARVLDGERAVGWLGALHPRVEKELDLGRSVYAFEMDLASITRSSIPAFKGPSRFPSIRRDLAVVVDVAVTAESVRNCVAQAGGELVREVSHFDVYTGQGIDPSRKSLAIGLILQADSRTLTDSEVESVVQGIVARLEGELKATLRK